MNKAEYEAIKARAKLGVKTRVGTARIAIICVDVFGNPIHPDALGPEAAAEFKAGAEGFAAAARDRATLVKFIEEGFDIEWPEDAKPTTALPSPLTGTVLSHPDPHGPATEPGEWEANR